MTLCLVSLRTQSGFLARHGPRMFVLAAFTRCGLGTVVNVVLLFLSTVGVGTGLVLEVISILYCGQSPARGGAGVDLPEEMC